MSETLNPERPEKLSLVVFSGDYDKVHYALVMASAAAATDTDVTVFFTMEGAKCMLRATRTNPPGWKRQPTSAGYDKGSSMDLRFETLGIADFETLLSACIELGVRFMVCEMGLKAMGLRREDLRDDVSFEVGGVVTFLNDAKKDGAMLFI